MARTNHTFFCRSSSTFHLPCHLCSPFQVTLPSVSLKRALSNWQHSLLTEGRDNIVLFARANLVICFRSRPTIIIRFCIFDPLKKLFLFRHLLVLLSPHNTTTLSQLSSEALDVSLAMDHYQTDTSSAANARKLTLNNIFTMKNDRWKWQNQNKRDLFLQKCLHLAKITRKVRQSNKPLYLRWKHWWKIYTKLNFLRCVRLARLGDARPLLHGTVRVMQTRHKALICQANEMPSLWSVQVKKTYTRKQTTMLTGTLCLASGEAGQSVKCVNSSVNCWLKAKQTKNKCKTQNCRKSDTHWCKQN